MHGILKLEIYKQFHHFYFLNKDDSVTIQDINLGIFEILFSK